MRAIRRIACSPSFVVLVLSIAFPAIGVNRSAAADPPEENSGQNGPHASATSPAAAADAGQVTTNQELGARLRLNRLGDLVVVAVRHNGPAERNGIRPGDEIVSIDGTHVDTPADVDRAFRHHDPDRDLRIVVKPGTQPRYITLALHRSPAANANISKPVHHAMLGVTIDAEDKRVVVSQLYSGGPAEEAGIKSGDVIESIDDHPVTSDKDVLNVLGQHKAGDSVDVVIERNWWRRTVRVPLARPNVLADRPVLTEVNNPTTRAQGPPVANVIDEEEGNAVDGDEENWQIGDTYENIRDPFLRARDTDFDG